MVTPKPGLYERLITEELSKDLLLLEPDLVQRGGLDPADSHEVLSRHIAMLAARALRAAKNDERVGLANRMVEAISLLSQEVASNEQVTQDGDEVLEAIAQGRNPDRSVSHPVRPGYPLTTSALLVNGRGQPSIGNEIGKELASADRVDLICAFITWHGIRVFEQQLAELIRRGAQLRVITTTYLGATDQKALDRLVELGAKVKISYDTRSTRLHAKAWLFRRHTTFDTAYVGSSNLSKTAQTTGLEWNVRLSAIEQPHLLDTFEATFDEYWASVDFADYDPERDRQRLNEALAEERGGPRDLPLRISQLEVRPWGYQEEVLNELDAERQVHNRWRNLVVMATGTGKTVVAGLDYQRLKREQDVDSLLFVAHRQEILKQSRDVFQQIMRDATFGELLGDGQRPAQWRHVFGSIQSLQNVDLEPDQFDMVIVDEFHHAAADTYRQLLSRVRPRVLLGLTATPERADGQDIKGFFDGRIAVELRLWEALERGLLAPFQYFGIWDGTDLTQLRWQRGGYVPGDLDRLYTGHVDRVRLVIQALTDKVSDPGAMRAIGFCVSIDHANFMAERFRDAGIPAFALTSRSSTIERQTALQALADRKVNVIFTVDLFNEGIDLPEIDTILLLRPTESATIFLQQLGRGLRIAPDKPCLTVLDFIGAQHKSFRFDLRYRAISGVTRRDLKREVAEGFPTLPAGCHINLDKVASQRILEHIKQSLQLPWNELAQEVKAGLTLSGFLEQTELDPADLYRRDKGGWVELKRVARIENRPPGPHDRMLRRAISRMLHTDDPERLDFWPDFLHSERPRPQHELSERHQRLARMLHTSLFGPKPPPSELEEAFASLLDHPARREELVELSHALRERLRRVTPEVPELDETVPLRLHARYGRFEILRAFDAQDARLDQGVKEIQSARADLFFVTLQKSSKSFSPSTMYADHAVSPELFQWESQSTTSDTSPTAQRYINHHGSGSSIHLFLRETGTADGQLGRQPFFYAGPMTYVEHSGSLPVRFLWRLTYPLPADVFHSAKVTTG